MTQIPGTPPRDYSAQAESAAEHLRNALQVLRNVERVTADGVPLTTWFLPLDQVEAVRDRVAAALALLETQP